MPRIHFLRHEHHISKNVDTVRHKRRQTYDTGIPAFSQNNNTLLQTGCY